MEIVYWLILFIFILIIWIMKKNSGFALSIAFTLFILAAILTVFNLRNLAETFMRLSLIGWLIGILQALLEYRTSNFRD